MIQETGNNSVGAAIGWLMFGVAGGLGLDLCAKALLETYPLAEFVFLRSVLGLTMFLALAPVFGGLRSLASARWRWHLLRAALASGAMFGFFFGLGRMPLVNALTLGFTAPLMVTALSVPLLGEPVGWRRWLAVLAGFGGVLMILRPGAGFLTPAAAAVLFAALCYACLSITSRHLGSTESSYSLSTYAVVGPLLISTVLVSNDYWVAPDASGWLLFLLAGACSVAAWVGLVGGYRRAPPSILAPFEYTALVGGAIAGYLIWDEVPDRWVVAGAFVIILSGIFLVHREMRNAFRYRRPRTRSV